MDNINDIIASLSAEDIKTLKETAEAIFGNNDNSSASFQSFNENSKKKADSFFGSGTFPDPELFAKIGKIMSFMQGGGSDRRCELIEALKPNLSQRRQQKADEALKILKMLEILPMLSELTGRGD